MVKHSKEYFEQQTLHLASLCKARKESIKCNKRKEIKKLRQQYLDDLSNPPPIKFEYTPTVGEPTLEEAEAWERRVREENPERAADLDKKRQEAKNKIVERSRMYYEQHKDKLKAYREENKEHLSVVRRIYSRHNKGKIQVLSIRRRASKLQRTPVWYGTDYHIRIKAIIDERVRLDEKTKTKHHVDHEMPLQGKLVSGLHVPDNLRVMNGSANLSKHNAWNPMNEIIMHKNDDGTYTQLVLD